MPDRRPDSSNSIDEDQALEQSLQPFHISETEPSSKYRRCAKNMEPKRPTVTISTPPRSLHQESRSSSINFPQSAVFPPYETLTIGTVPELANKNAIVRGSSRTGGDTRQTAAAYGGTKSPFHQA